MFAIESLIVDGVLLFAEADAVNAFFNDPRTTARIVGVLVAIAAGTLGSILMLRGMSLMSDAISHTVLLGITVAFIVMTRLFGAEPDLASPWLILGASAAGVATVAATEAIRRSGLVRADAALGLVFPALFAAAVILVAQYVDNVHLDTDAVMVGEIGVAWADTNGHVIGTGESVTITPDDPRATTIRRCVNCGEEGISPRDPAARFVEICGNCGTYAAIDAWRAGFVAERPTVVYWPASVTVAGLTVLVVLAVVALFFKEIKITTFDPQLARSLGFHPEGMMIIIMALASLVAVAAFNAIGSILVIAFFIIPAAAAYLLTDRFGVMVILSAAVGSLAAWWGYDLARGRLFGAVAIGSGWNTSISASMVVMMLTLFVLVLLLSPRFGLVATIVRRRRRSHRFRELIVLRHVAEHGTLPPAGRRTDRRHAVAVVRRGLVTVDHDVAGIDVPAAGGAATLSTTGVHRLEALRAAILGDERGTTT